MKQIIPFVSHYKLRIWLFDFSDKKLTNTKIKQNFRALIFIERN